jgi:hypothetical protein
MSLLLEVHFKIGDDAAGALGIDPDRTWPAIV